jgi:Sigma-70, region 4
MDSKNDPDAAQSATLGRSEPRASVDPNGPVGPTAGQGAAPTTEGALALDAGAAPVPVTREQRRSRRKRAIRARTISVKRMTKRELELGRMLYPEVEKIEHPRTRADCVGGERPCPFVSCKHHLYLDVSARTGAIKLNFPDLEVWEMTETCALDVADRGGTTLEEVGAIMNLTRERIRQVEVKGLAKLAALRDMSTLRDYVEEGPTGKRRLPVLEAAPDEDEADEDLEEGEAEAGDEGETRVAGEVNVEAFSVDLD